MGACSPADPGRMVVSSVMDAWWRWPSFGYPDAASDAFKSSVGYKDWLVDEKDVAGDERVVRRRPED